MSGATYINRKGALPKGMSLPKPPSPKYRNLISADGQTYYLFPSRVFGSEKFGAGKQTKKFMLDFAERFDAKKSAAMLIGVQRGVSSKPIDCSYVDASHVVLHSTSAAEIISKVDQFARLASGAAVAMFDLPKNFHQAISLKLKSVKSVKSITFSGRAGAKVVDLCIEYEKLENIKGLGSFEAVLKGDVFSNFSATLDAKDVSKYLWNEAFFVRLTDKGIFEFEAEAMNGTLYLIGKLAE
jgi:hypothetical protein